jgi:hypothetical protein
MDPDKPKQKERKKRLRKDLSWIPHLFRLLPRWPERLSAACRIFASAWVTQQTQVLDKNRLLHICCRASANNFATMM